MCIHVANSALTWAAPGLWNLAHASATSVGYKMDAYSTLVYVNLRY